MKLNRMLCLITLAFTQLAIASDVNPMLNDTKIKLPAPKTGVQGKVSMNCTDSNGKILKSGEAGYEDCLQSSSVRTRKDDPAKKPSAGAGFNLGGE